MKNELRKAALIKRKTLDCTSCSKKAMQNLFSLQEYKNSKNIICYYPIKYEISDMDCINDKTKNIYLPRVNGKELEICPYQKGKMKEGCFKIQEPSTEKITSFENIDMIIIPAVAADKKGFRIGYGKGYYDRFLLGLPKKIIKIILLYDELLSNNIFPDIFDIKADIIVTDRTVYKI